MTGGLGETEHTVPEIMCVSQAEPLGLTMPLTHMYAHTHCTVFPVIWRREAISANVAAGGRTTINKRSQFERIREQKLG